MADDDDRKVGDRRLTCRSCRWFDKDDVDSDFGSCHYNAPEAGVRLKVEYREKGVPAAIWPMVCELDWCRQHIPSTGKDFVHAPFGRKRKQESENGNDES